MKSCAPKCGLCTFTDLLASASAWLPARPCGCAPLPLPPFALRGCLSQGGIYQPREQKLAACHWAWLVRDGREMDLRLPLVFNSQC